MQWTLTTDSTLALDALRRLGLDLDLAFSILEDSLSEDEMYRAVDDE